MPLGASLRISLSRGRRRRPTRWPATSRSSTRPWGSSARAKLVVVDAEDEEVGVLRVEPEQLVADGAADEVRVEPERADVVLDLPSAPVRREAIASISTSAPEGSAEISTVDRAGRLSPTCRA